MTTAETEQRLQYEQETGERVRTRKPKHPRTGDTRMTTARPMPPPRSSLPAATAVEFGQLASHAGHRVLVYGPGGIGKTTLAATAPGPVAVFDLDDSLNVLADSLADYDVRPVIADDWASIRNMLAGSGWDSIKTIVIDSATKAEELCAQWVLANVKHEKGNRIARIEDYGFGKGYQHIYETWLCLLNDLDKHVKAGRNVILIAHDCTTSVPNPTGEDWLRYEPRLQSPGSGKGSIRLRVREWCDHMLYIGYDVEVTDRKGRGSGTRTIYPNELPHCMAKSRTLRDPMYYQQYDATLWNTLFRTPKGE